MVVRFNSHFETLFLYFFDEPVNLAAFNMMESWSWGALLWVLAYLDPPSLPSVDWLRLCAAQTKMATRAWGLQTATWVATPPALVHYIYSQMADTDICCMETYGSVGWLFVSLGRQNSVVLGIQASWSVCELTWPGTHSWSYCSSLLSFTLDYISRCGFQRRSFFLSYGRRNIGTIRYFCWYND